ncbi:MAG: hypothetical protein PHS53_00775 [Candidatus Pacebacteria bacterium]|nr:hypothetical protein [Candidatus Paceibacterota bacterium]MDD5356670.1 hypothetical protein [Candidatus Paceibacterota bacterium]
MNIEDPNKQQPDEQGALVQKSKIEQIQFPKKVEIVGGESYKGGVIEILDNRAIRFSGFHLDQPFEFGKPEDIIKYDYGYRPFKEMAPRSKLPRISSTSFDLKNLPPQGTRDAINIMFYSGIVTPPSFSPDPVSESDNALQGKLDILSHSSLIEKAIQFTKERPNLASETFAYICRDYVFSGSHSRTQLLIPFLVSHPEMLDYFPNECKSQLTGILLKKFREDLASVFRGSGSLEEKKSRLEKLGKELSETAKLFDIDTEKEEIKREFSRANEDLDLKLQDL